jgi:predicted acylesterase/phospholipase RssA
MPKKLKVAVVMGGGWSLGAFSGGAVWELAHQLHANLDRAEFDRCEIDVLAGAGAGALTAAVLLRTLANPEGFGTAAAVARVGEALREAWLEGADFSRLMRRTAMRKAALLDRSAMDDLATELLAWPAGQAAQPVLLGERVLLGVTLLNFNGVPVRPSNTPALPPGLTTTAFRDRRVFCFDFAATPRAPLPRARRFAGPRTADADAWREVAATAVASGAFPIAFEPVVLQRYRHEYGPLWPDELADRDEFPFTYGDGGTFNHRPLHDAMELIAAQDAAEEPGAIERALVFVDPNLSGSKHAFGLKFHLPYMVSGDRADSDRHEVVPADPAAHLVAITNRFGVLARHQSTVEDFIAAAKTNVRLARRAELHALVHDLAARLAASDAAALADAVEARLDRGPGNSSEPTPAPAARLTAALTTFIDDVADLRGKEPVRVFVVGPTEFVPPDGSAPITVRLAGDFFANFGGFFDPRFRVHDFDAGRALAAAALAATPPLLADPADRPPYVPWSDRAPSLDAVPAARHRFVQRIGELTRQLLEYKIGFLGVTQAIAIVAQYVAPRLVRDSGPGRRPAIVRIEIEPTAGDADFFLAPHNGAAGGDARHVGGLVVLHTALHYSDTEIVGPHVVRTAAGWALRLAARSKHPRARVLEIPLPDPAVLRANADCGLPIHRIRVDWATRTLGPWLQEDALQEWPGAYEV